MSHTSKLHQHWTVAGAAATRTAAWLTEEERHPSTKKLFRIVFYGWLLLHTALLLPFHQEIWAPAAFTLRESFDGSFWFHWFGRLALHPALEGMYAFFIVGQLATLVLGMSIGGSRIVALLIAFFTLNVDSLATPVLDGGNNLAELLVLYLIFVDTSGERRSATGTWSRLRIAASNMALCVMRVQVVVVYLTAGMLKLNGELWQRGMALYYILQADAFSHPLMNRIVTTWPWIGMLGTYTTLLFQWLFPTMVWFRRTRPWILALGVALHLGIAFGMGLLTFGLIMCIVYILFLPEGTTARVLAWTGSQPRLEVRVAPQAPALARLVHLLQRLSPAESISSAAQAPADELLEVVAEDGRVDRDFLGLLRLITRCRWTWLLLPLHPILWLLWYTGLGDSLLARLESDPVAMEQAEG